MNRFVWVLVIVLGFNMPAFGQREEGPSSRQPPCATRCAVALADCEQECNRTDRDVQREIVCVEGCYDRYGSCREGCRERVRGGLSSEDPQ